MNKKILLGFAFLIAIQSSFATEKFENIRKPFKPDAVFESIIGYSRICSDLQPQNAALYRKNMMTLFSGYEEELKKFESDSEFQEKLIEARVATAAMPKAKQDVYCDDVLSMMKELIEPSKSEK